MLTRLFLLSFLLVFIACDIDDDNTEDPIFCTQELRPGIEVIVKDAADETILFEGVKVVIIENEYQETLEGFSGGSSFFGAYEREGIYTVEVSKENYKKNTTSSITVDKDLCHVITEKVEVLLEKNQ